ncbi:MAG: DUF411 domain-containing protein [Leptolyngbyaceae bacterium]|nr:DUF411 domain-containing protein [Leptolyngbyaceae bacterium]
MKFRWVAFGLNNAGISPSSLVAIALITASLALSSCSLAQGSGDRPIAEAVDITMAQPAATDYEITVFRSPTCGCCGQWIEHMQAAGFTVKDEITQDMDAVKQQYGISSGLASCHTTVAGNYVIEGHVPAEDVQRLLAEAPDIAGIAVPGMPIGSPGMESGSYIEPYTVIAFSADGTNTVFANHP